jgi:hypothetical protein
VSDPPPPPGFAEDTAAQSDVPMPEATTGAVSAEPDLPAQYWTPRLKAADEAVSRNAHLLSILPLGSPQHDAAIVEGRQISAEYNAARAQALAAMHSPQPAAQTPPPPPGFTEDPAPPPGFTVDADAPPDPQPAPLGAMGKFGLGARDLLEGVGNIGDFAMRPANWISNVGVPAQYQTVPGGATQAMDTIADAIGLPTAQTDTERLISAANRAGTGAILTGGAETVPALVGTALSGVGSGGGAELARQHGAGPTGQLLASLAGGMVAPTAMAGGGGVVDAFTPMAQRELTPTMQAFENQQVPALPADVGGRFVRGLTAGASKMTIGGPAIEEAASASSAATAAARGRIAGQMGDASDPLQAGTAAQKGASRFLDTSEAEAAQHYDAIPVPDEAPAQTSATRAGLIEVTRGLPSNPELSKIWAENSRLNDTLDALTARETAASRAADMATAQRALATARQRVALQPDAQAHAALAEAERAHAAEVARAATPLRDGSIDWRDLKALRTIVGKIIGRPGLSTEGDTVDKLRALYAGLSQDIKDTARAHGNPALLAFKRANSFWEKRQKTIADIITPILGKNHDATPEEAFRAIQSWAANKGSFIHTARLFKLLPDKEAGAVRATIFNALGIRADGTFTPTLFLKHWNDMNARTRAVLFPGVRYQKDIGEVLEVAGAQKAASALQQGSPTAHLAQAAHLPARIAGAIYSAGTGQFHAAGGFLADIAGEHLTGKLLSSPGFARWLASSAKKPNAAAQLAHVDRLTALAAAQPQIASNVIDLQSRLRASLQAPQLPLAARVPDQPTTKPRDYASDVLARAQAKYPFIKQYNPVVMTGKAPAAYANDYAETWLPGNRGSPKSPRPANIPVNGVGINIYRPGKFGPDDLAGELIHADPFANQTRTQFMASLSPAQKETLKRTADDYADTLRGGESQQKAMQNAADSALRGYTVGQWDAASNAAMHYTAAQVKMLDALKSYMRTGRR